MSITINSIETPLTLDDFTSEVEIFMSTKARDIPTKLNTIASDLKIYSNAKVDTMQAYINETIVPHLNTELTKMENDYNTQKTNIANQQSTFNSDITNQQNTFETAISNQQDDFEVTVNNTITNLTTQQNDFETDITAQQNSFETAINNQQSTYQNTVTSSQTNFENHITSSIGQYTGASAGYTVAQMNNFFMTSAISSESYVTDGDGKIVSITEGYKTTSNITYADNGSITGYTETIVVDSIPYTRSFEIAKDTSNKIIITVV